MPLVMTWAGCTRRYFDLRCALCCIWMGKSKRKKRNRAAQQPASVSPASETATAPVPSRVARSRDQGTAIRILKSLRPGDALPEYAAGVIHCATGEWDGPWMKARCFRWIHVKGVWPEDLTNILQGPLCERCLERTHDDDLPS